MRPDEASPLSKVMDEGRAMTPESNAAVCVAASVRSSRLPEELMRRVDQFLFDGAQWVNREALKLELMSGTGLAQPDDRIDFSQMGAVQLQQLLARAAPLRDISLARLCRDWQTRLALLDAADWMRLGFTLSVLPLCGQVQRSMDGNFRRALRDRLGPDAPTVLDGLAGQGAALRFLAGAGAWKNPEWVAAGGVRAAFEQVCPWGDAVRRRFALRFAPAVLAVAPSVEGLDETWLEIACRLTLQDHPWLWS